MDPSYLPVREHESRQVRELASQYLSRIASISDRPAFMKALNNITDEVIGVAEAKKRLGRGSSAPSQAQDPQRGGEDHAFHVDTDLLKTPSGQMLQKLKNLRSSINRNITGDGPYISQEIPYSSLPQAAPVEREGRPPQEPAQAESERRRGPPSRLEEDDMSQVSASGESFGSAESQSCGSLSVGNYVLKFQKYFSRQIAGCGNRCSIDVLKAGLKTDDQICMHIPTERLHLLYSRLSGVQAEGARDLSMAGFVSLVVAACSPAADAENRRPDSNAASAAFKPAATMRVDTAPPVKSSPTRGAAHRYREEDFPTLLEDHSPTHAAPSAETRTPPPPREAFTEKVVFTRRASPPPSPPAGPSLPPPRAREVREVAFSRQVPPQSSPHFTHVQPTDYFKDAFDAPGVPVWAAEPPPMAAAAPLAQTPPPPAVASVAAPRDGASNATLPAPMSGVSGLDTSADVAPPPAVKAKHLPLPEVRFRADTGEVDLSRGAVQPKRAPYPLKSAVSVGDSIDLSGLTAQRLSDLIAF